MNAIGRLTAPPQFEDVLATNSVCGFVKEEAIALPASRGTLLDTSPFDIRFCIVQSSVRPATTQRGIIEFGCTTQSPQLTSRPFFDEAAARG